MSNHAKTAHEAHLSEAIRGWQLGLNPNRPPHHRRRRRPVGSVARRGKSPGAAAAGPGARPPPARGCAAPAARGCAARASPPAMGGRGAAPRCARPRLSGIDARVRGLGSARGATPAARLPDGAAALPQEHEAWPRHKRSPLAARGSPGACGSRGPGGERAGAALGGAGATAPTAQRGAAMARRWAAPGRCRRVLRPRLGTALALAAPARAHRPGMALARESPAQARGQAALCVGTCKQPLCAWVRWPPTLSRAGTAPAMRARRPAPGGPWARRPWPKTTNRGQKKSKQRCLSNVRMQINFFYVHFCR
jgi:hypothetical protein